MKNFFDRIFGKINMSWRNTLLFALVTGVYTGLVMVPDFLKETSFQDIGISYEWWVVFAVIVVVNCEKKWDAMVKCFVFFLVSQPLVYLVQVICGAMTMDMAIYYYTKIWLWATFLTIPGGLIAWYCKKQSSLGAVVLGLGNTIQMVMGAAYIARCASSFPHHLLTALFCFASAIVMSLCIQKEKKQRIIALLIPVIITAVVLVLLKMTGRTL